ncbi:protein of unknown function [Pseudomonas sp. JV551A1]|nr:protein of unknown function [Pseudomonas sp. JV551A1]
MQPIATQGRSHSYRATSGIAQNLWERPCVAIGAQSAPGVLSGNHSGSVFIGNYRAIIDCGW